MNQHEGIVLKNYCSKTREIVVFDEHLGKIRCLPRTQIKRISAGTLLDYSVDEARSMYRIEHLELQKLPLTRSYPELHLLHHVLEVAYYFLAAHQPAKESFELVRFLICSYDLIRTNLQKKLFLLRFFLQLGMYPEWGRDMTKKSLYCLLSQPVEVMLKQSIPVSECRLEQWLWLCLEAHPRYMQFKTVDTKIKRKSYV